tara:strand:- start:225 stop:1076 length:852 start_codon:yes stop_codon:yes gene_type:complete
MNDKKITIIINTFNSEEKIYNCLNSIPNEYKVVIVENSKNSEFKNKVEQKYFNVECMLAGDNLGYAKGNNLGLSKVNSEYALILNPDAKLDKNTLRNFFITASKIKDFSIIGPAKQDEFTDNKISLGKQDFFEVDKLKGFAMFLNMKQFKDIGFFDENFFIYLEEIDLCKRLRKDNKKIYLDKNIIIHHLGGRSHDSSIDFEMELSRNWHWMWSTFYYNRKHYGYFFSLLKTSGKLFSSLINLIFFSIIFKNKKREIYFQRFSGLINSILGRKSWYRPKILSN